MASDLTLPLIVNDVAATADTVNVWWTGGEAAWIVRGTWGGGNVTLEYKDPAGSWVAVTTAATANAYTIVKIPAGQVRSVRTTATGVYSYLIGVRTN